jgi:hypothetical protein
MSSNALSSLDEQRGCRLDSTTRFLSRSRGRPKTPSMDAFLQQGGIAIIRGRRIAP